MNASASATRWWSTALSVGGVVALLLLVLGPLGSRFGLWGFELGFLMLGGAAVLSVFGVVLGLLALIVTYRKSLAGDRPGVLVGLVVGVFILGLFGVQMHKAFSLPRIHNVSTDVDDPPQFVALVEARGPDANDVTYDAAALAAQQRTAYPWVQPLDTDLSPTASFDRALSVLDDMGLDVVATDRDAGRIEATATTLWFGFKDDLVVRIRATDGGGSRIDLHSVSRVGQSDLGANARRVGEFLHGFADASG